MNATYERERSALDEATVRLVLLRNKGDLILSAGQMQIRPSTLVRWIKSVPSITALWQEMEQVKADPAFTSATQVQFEQEIRERTSLYRLDGLEVLHELATTPHESASMAEVRLKAAIELKGATDIGGHSQGNVLAELNTLYHANAHRIKSMRAVQIEFADALADPVQIG